MPLEKHMIKDQDGSNGHFKSTTALPAFRQPLSITKQCLSNYFVAYIRNNKVLTSNCLETSPRWMQDIRDVIQDVPFTHVPEIFVTLFFVILPEI